MVLPPRMCVRRPDQNLSLSCPARPPPMMTFTTPQVQSSSRSNIFLLGGMSVINAAHFLRRNQQKQSSSTACHLPIAQVSPPPLAITMKPAEIITVWGLPSSHITWSHCHLSQQIISRTLTASPRSGKNAHFPHPARASARTQLKIDAIEAGDTWGGAQPINTSVQPSPHPPSYWLRERHCWKLCNPKASRIHRVGNHN